MAQESRVISSIVNDLKREFEDYLIAMGYKPNVYRCDEEREIIQYRDVPCPDYDVPVLMTDMGCDSFERLTIAVGTDGKNKTLHDKLLELFDKYGIEAHSFSKRLDCEAYDLQRI